MKDYYKILGVEEEASDEEIRARWLELAKRYHPDLGKTKEGDEKIKEINEAYEVLIDNSKRFDYDYERDLKRSIIKQAHHPEERRMTIRKIVIPAGILVLFLIVGLVSLRWLHVTSSPKMGVPDEMDKVLEKKPASQMPSVKTESRVEGDQEVPKEINKEAIPQEEVIPQESKKIVSVSPPRSPSGVESESKKREEPAPQILPKSKAPVQVEEEVPVKEEPGPVKELIPQVAIKSEAPVKIEKEAPKKVPEGIPKEGTGVILQPGKKITIKTAPPPSLVKEEEVKRFFSDYVDRYNRKDIDGFLSFFSSKAVQNQKDGLKGIRTIYTKYFDQSQELRYHVEGMKTEIYQNAVEVKARFRVDQKLKKSGEEKVWKGNIRWVLVMEDGRLKVSTLDYQNEKSP